MVSASKIPLKGLWLTLLQLVPVGPLILQETILCMGLSAMRARPSTRLSVHSKSHPNYTVTDKFVAANDINTYTKFLRIHVRASNGVKPGSIPTHLCLANDYGYAKSIPAGRLILYFVVLWSYQAAVSHETHRINLKLVCLLWPISSLLYNTHCSQAAGPKTG